jgi:signal transduction histidine kinase
MNESLWWMLTLAVSGGFIVTYWLIARRQVRGATAELQAALDRERRIVAQVSHRLRNPLTVIYGFSETLVDTSLLGDRDEISKVAAIVNAEALDVSRTVEDLVTAQEVDRGELAVRSVGFDPRDEIERVVTPFRRLGSSISVEAWSGTATSDPIRFRHALQALVSNAVRHGGSEISIYADLDGSWYRCTVADDGEGLTEGTADRLFGDHRGTSPDVGTDDVGPGTPDDAEPRARRDEPAGILAVDPASADGLGLGLPVAVTVARRLGGALTYERARDFSAFTLSLPTESWPGPLEPLHVPELPDAADADEADRAGARTPDQHPADGPTVRFDDLDSEAVPASGRGADVDPVDEDHDQGAVRS